MLLATMVPMQTGCAATPSYLTARSIHFVNEKDEPVILKGCNLGSWLNLEMWMMDIKNDELYPDQYTIEKILTERFGKQEKDRIMDLHRANWITERDFKYIKSLGFNVIRVPFHYNIIEDDDNPMQLKKDAWRWFDYVIAMANKYDLYVILDLHAAAGCQNKFDHSGRREWNKLWEDRTYWDRTAWLWEEIAKRYNDCATIAAYQPINEPWGGTMDQQVELFDFLYKAIRKHDPRHVIISSAHFTGFDHFGDPKDHGWEGVGFSQNFYPGMFGGGPIRPETHHGHLAWIKNDLKNKVDKLDIPFLVTEFNVVFNEAGGADMMRRHFDTYAANGWAATQWSYKLITSPGRKNTGGWWLITNTGEEITGAWWIVTNATPLPPVDFRTADKIEIENWFKSFSTVDYQVNEGLEKALTTKEPPPPIKLRDIVRLSAPTVNDTVPGWTATDVNGALPGGQKVAADGAIDLYASGGDIWAHEDQFRYLHKRTSDDFELTVTLDGLTFTDTYAKSGIMVRQSLDKASAFASVGSLADGSIEFNGRASSGAHAASRLVMGPEFPGIRYRIIRKGNKFERYFACADGGWDAFDTFVLGEAGDEVYLGLFAISHDNTNYTTATFREIEYKSTGRTDSPKARSNVRLDNGQWLLGNSNYPAISYSGDRKVERTMPNTPSVDEIKEDIQILHAMGFRLLRTYNTAEFPQSERILQVIRELKQADPTFEMYVMLGAWINCKGAYKGEKDHTKEDLEWNTGEIERAIELAGKYPDIAKIIAVGNETMVDWQAHFVPAWVILKWVNYLHDAREGGRFPRETLITTCDNWAALGGTANYHNADLLELHRRLDFVCLHTYAFHDTHYNQELVWGVASGEEAFPRIEQAKLSIGRAIALQKAQYQSVKRFLATNNIDKPIHLGETGWATLDNSLYGKGGTCAGDEYLAKLFYEAVQAWTREENITCFYFEAFDEPWKSGGTAGSEGHFGLITVDGQAKFPIWDLVDAGVFEGLTRGGSPIRKTHGGNPKTLIDQLQIPKARNIR